jgi:hypothetical protein
MVEQVRMEIRDALGSPLLSEDVGSETITVDYTKRARRTLGVMRLSTDPMAYSVQFSIEGRVLGRWTLLQENPYASAPDISPLPIGWK